MWKPIAKWTIIIIVIIILRVVLMNIEIESKMIHDIIISMMLLGLFWQYNEIKFLKLKNKLDQDRIDEFRAIGKRAEKRYKHDD